LKEGILLKEALEDMRSKAVPKFNELITLQIDTSLGKL